jgi:hypothetical protein
MQDNDDAAHRPGLPLARGCQKIVCSGGEACRMRRGKESHRRIQRQESIGLDRRLQNSRLLLPRRSNVAPLAWPHHHFLPRLHTRSHGDAPSDYFTDKWAGAILTRMSLTQHCSARAHVRQPGAPFRPVPCPS